MSTFDDSQYYVKLAACFCRGRLGLAPDVSDAEALKRGSDAKLRLAKFKRNAELPRVRKVLGILRGLAPHTLLDVGSGRGTFLWPLLDERPELSLTAADVDPQRAADLHAVQAGGLTRLDARLMDANALGFEDGAFEGVTALEVLEHMPEPERVARECVRVARRFVIASVPLHEDDNPEHLHLLHRARLSAMFEAAGAARVRFDAVHNHLIAIVTL